MQYREAHIFFFLGTDFPDCYESLFFPPYSSLIAIKTRDMKEEQFRSFCIKPSAANVHVRLDDVFAHWSFPDSRTQ